MAVAAAAELAAAAAAAGERPQARGSSVAGSLLGEETPPFPPANASLLGLQPSEEPQDHFPPKPPAEAAPSSDPFAPLTAEVAAAAAEDAAAAAAQRRSPSPEVVVSAMERLAAAMQSKRASSRAGSASTERPRSRTSSVDHSAEPSTPRPGSAGNPLEPITFRRCVCDSQVRHGVRELRGQQNQFGGHMVRCKECQGFAPENSNRYNRSPARPTTGGGGGGGGGGSRGRGRPVSRREIVRPKTRPSPMHPSTLKPKKPQ